MTSRQLDEERVFHVARQIPVDDVRSEYLDQVCAGDQALRSRVEALLEVHENEMELLRSAPEATHTADHTPVTEAPGQQIGRFKLLQQIGEGGFGVVYMAEQMRPVRRKVALKIIKPGMDTHAVVARFEAERQALALMDHANIARVLDGGATDSGRPYFVMELVKGVPITEFCDKNQLSTAERLMLFMSVCQAVQHAHQKGIIHRDLKPSNVLVTLADGQPVAKVIDFGVAKATNQQLTEKTLFTAHGQMVGTPQYMSPEQAEMSCLDVDTRSDVYSLGVLLYELLTGTTPLEGERLRSAGYVEMQRLIREEEPPRPSTRLSTSGDKLTVIAKHRSVSPEKLKHQVQGDLDWIVMKALEKDRNRRYESPMSLADDVDRLLGDQPVSACPPSSAYRFRKFIRRNKAFVWTAATVVIALILATATSSRFAYISWKKSTELEKIAGDLQTTVANLQTEILDRALADALAGDVSATEESLKRARQAGADPKLIEVFRALAYLYGGELETSLRLLEASEVKNPDNFAVLAALYGAHAFSGHQKEVHELWQRIYHLESAQGTPRNDYERLLLISTKIFATSNPQALIEDVDDIISRHKRWGIAYAIRSDLKRQLAQQTQRMQHFRQALEDAALAQRYHPDNPFVRSGTMLTYTFALELARHQDAPTQEIDRLESEAGIVAAQLDGWEEYLKARGIRLGFYRLTGRDEEYDHEYQALLEAGFGGDHPAAARSLVKEDASDLRALLEKRPDSCAVETANAIRTSLEGDIASALEELKEIWAKHTNLNHRWLMLDVAFISGRPDLARELALKSLGDFPPGDSPALVKNVLLMTRYYADKCDEGKVISECGPFQIDSSVGHYAIGMRKLSTARTKAELAEAKSHLLLAADCPMPGWWHVVFAKAYLELLDEERLPLWSIE